MTGLGLLLVIHLALLISVALVVWAIIHISGKMWEKRLKRHLEEEKESTDA